MSVDVENNLNARLASGRTLDPEGCALLAALRKAGAARGSFEQLGTEHSAIVTDRRHNPNSGPNSGLNSGPDVPAPKAKSCLLVTFETIGGILADSESDLPLGFDLADEAGWSHICLLAHGASWFRDADVYAYFDGLVDTCFFDDFDQVVFYGAGMCGYGAAAFSVAAPGARVIALQPQATLDPDLTEWDRRFNAMRRTPFGPRYGYAPDMLEAAAQAFVIYDPEEEMDAMHAALFARPNVTRLRWRHMGERIERAAIGMDILGPMITCAMSDAPRPVDFARLYRARHNYSPYLRRVLARLEDDDRLKLAGILCRNVISRLNGARFRRRLEKIEARLNARGESLAPEHRHETA